MLQSRIKGSLYFAAFVLPALLLYGLFFLYPFAQGIRISFTNWDGLTPRTPISMPKNEFEEKILDRARGAREREFLLGIYHLDASDNLYKRYSISGAARYRLQRILRKAGYQPDSYRSVGLSNYIQIFAGKVEQRFYPHTFVKTNYNEDSDLPASIPTDEFERRFLATLLNADERRMTLEHYERTRDGYVLRPQYDGFAL